MSPSSSATGKTSDINVDRLVGRKMRDHYQQNFRENVSAPTSEFAKKQLEKMGWSEGTGLGKKRDGMTTHIRVKKRKDNVGLGGSDKPEVEAVLGDSEWWKDSLGSTLARLGNKKKDKKEKKKDKKKGKKEKKSAADKKFTDEELFAATGGARFGMRAGITNNLHKWTRTENDDQEGSSSDDGNMKEEPKSLTAQETEDSSSTANMDKKSKKRKGQVVEGKEADLSDERMEKNNTSKKDTKKRQKVVEAEKLAKAEESTKASSSSDSKKRRKELKKARKDKKSKKNE